MPKRKFNPRPFAYHQEIELEIATLTNLGVGLGRVPLAGPLPFGTCDLELPPANAGGWVVMVPFGLPGERVRARVFRNHPNYSEADLVAVLAPSPHRVAAPRCPLFGRCGGCQYQNLAYAEQLRWKQRQVAELLHHLAGLDCAVAPVVPSPRDFGYRSKITPHFSALRREKEVPNAKFQIPNEEVPSPEAGQSVVPAQNGELGTLNPEAGIVNQQPAAAADFPIGFLRQGSRHEVIDVPNCAIATEAINLRLSGVRAEVLARRDTFKRDGTLLLRDAAEGVTTDYSAVITEIVAVADPPAAPLRLRFLARDFFQNNPFILPAFARHVRDQAAAGGAEYLIDAYCGSGLFALASAGRFARVAGIEVSESSVAFARENAAANGIANATFRAGDAAAIFAGVDFPPVATAVVIDPPRKGCDEAFLQQLFAFGPRTVVYVSCDPATQMRDLRQFLAAGYAPAMVQPFDLFPQTRHLECVITLEKSGPTVPGAGIPHR
jgi:23S rRNA (uracil1939-C5)-methyltransferase/tRNA (uracil-5-)-methyltransferase